VQLEEVFLLDLEPKYHGNFISLFFPAALIIGALAGLLVFMGALFASNWKAPLLVKALSTSVKLLTGVFFMPMLGVFLRTARGQTHHDSLVERILSILLIVFGLPLAMVISQNVYDEDENSSKYAPICLFDVEIEESRWKGSFNLDSFGKAFDVMGYPSH